MKPHFITKRNTLFLIFESLRLRLKNEVILKNAFLTGQDEIKNMGSIIRLRRHLQLSQKFPFYEPVPAVSGMT